MTPGRVIPAASFIMLYPRDDGEVAWPSVEQACAWLGDREIAVGLPGPFIERVGRPLPSRAVAVDLDALPETLDLVVALGGDGTFLRASRVAAGSDVPVVGVNLGDLGFLSAYRKEELVNCLADAVAGQLSWEPRLRMVVEVHRDGQVMSAQAVNDVYIKHGEIPRLLRMGCRIAGRHMATYKADGLIICTPLGSTAYNLAAGGPIVDPGASAFTIAPICPHSLTHRPVVTSAANEIEITYSGPSDVSSAFINADGQWSFELAVGDVIRVREADRPLRMVPGSASVFQVLAVKMGWSQPDVVPRG